MSAKCLMSNLMSSHSAPASQPWKPVMSNSSCSFPWEDIKFDIKHFAHIERLAMVGERKWQHGMATFCKPFTTATIRYFDHADAAEALEWLRESRSDGESAATKAGAPEIRN